MRSQALDEPRIQVRFRREPEHGHVEPPQPQHESREQSERARASHGGAAGTPDPQAPLHLEGLGDALLDHGDRLEQHAHFGGRAGHANDVVVGVDVALGEEAMHLVDAALPVDVVGGQVLAADGVVDALARAAHRRHHVIARLEVPDVGTHALDHAEALVAQHQDLLARWRRAVLGGVDLAVGAVDADPQHLHQHAVATGNVVDLGRAQLSEVGAALPSGEDGNRSHESLLSDRVSRMSLPCAANVTDAVDARTVQG